MSETFRHPILKFENGKPPKRTFDFVVCDYKMIFLEIKYSKDKKITIPWEDVNSQIKAALAEAIRETKYIA